jgi:DNA mismatch repair protein MutS2
MTGFFAGDSTALSTGFASIWEELLPKSSLGRRVKAKERPRLPGEEQELREEFSSLSRAASFYEKHPEAASRLEGILESLKDPLHVIALLEDRKTLSPAELFIVAHLAFSSGRARAVLLGTKDSDWAEEVVPPSLSAIERRLLPGTSGQPVFYIGDSFSPELEKVRAERKNRERRWREEMTREARQVEALLSRRPGLKEEIAIRKTEAELVQKARLMPELGETRETLTHVHFRLKATREAVRLEREINRLRQREVSLEEEVLAALSLELVPSVPYLIRAAWALGKLDYLLAKARLYRSWGASVPEIASGFPHIILTQAFHPEIRKQVTDRGGRFQPVTIELDSTAAVITGPNMGGKTVALSTVGLCVALAQWALPVPCRHMKFTLYDFVYFQPQSTEKPGLSSFAAEVVSLKEPLRRAGERGLVLLDEIGRGTNPSQGLALYAAVLLYFRERRSGFCTVVATTHFHALAEIAAVPHWQVTGLTTTRGLAMSGSSESPGSELTGGLDWLYDHMDYGLQRVGPETPVPQDALLVAKLLGLDAEIIKRAEALFDEKNVS